MWVWVWVGEGHGVGLWELTVSAMATNSAVSGLSWDDGLLRLTLEAAPGFGCAFDWLYFFLRCNKRGYCFTLRPRSFLETSFNLE